MIGTILAEVLLTVVTVVAATYIAALALTYAVIRSESGVGMARTDRVNPPKELRLSPGGPSQERQHDQN
jgi:hypothetical protein